MSYKKCYLKDLILHVNAGVSVNSEDRKINQGEFGILKTSCVSTGIFRAEENKVILKSELPKAKVQPHKDRIIISRMNTPELVGANAYIPTTYNNLFLPDRLWQLEPKREQVDMKWLSSLLRSNKYRRMLSFLGSGTSNSMKNITKEDLLSLPLLLPPLPVQRKIAKILSSWDQAIEKTEELIVKETKIKAGLAAQLLSFSANRLYPQLQLNKFLIPTSYPAPKPTTGYNALSIRSHGKGTFQRFVEDPDKVAMETLYQVHPNELIVNITFAWEGAIAIVTEDDSGKYVSHRFPTFKFKETIVLREFFRHVIKTKRFVFLLGLISPGGAGRNRVLDQKDFLKLEWPIPPIKLQKEIANLLNCYDKRIEKLKGYRETLSIQKQGLMTKLFSGDILVNK